MQIEQSTYAAVAKYQSRTAVAIFARPTRSGSLLVAVDATAGTIPSRVSKPSGFTTVIDAGLRDIGMNVWYWQNAPPTISVSTTALDDNKSHQLRVFEISGVAQTNALDKVTLRYGETRDPFTDSTGNTSQADELVMGFVVNQYASTYQTGFAGGLTRLFETTSPQSWSGGTNQDWERSRLSVHLATPATISNFHLHCDLSTTRRWLACLLTFRGGSLGPARMSSTVDTADLDTNGSGTLSVFGPLSSKDETTGTMCSLKTSATGRIGPFNYQYRVGGWKGLLIGSGTEFHVEGTEGLGGWTVRTSDDPLPRGDGALRGIDLQESRQILFKMRVGKSRAEVERNMAALYRALAIQRDTDIELLFRFPTEPLKMMRVRPVDLQRMRNRDQIQFAGQNFALQAADPRHYGAIPNSVRIPVTPSGTTDPLVTQVVNIGNSAAHPIIYIEGPAFGSPVTRLQLVNETALVSFEVEMTLLKGSLLIGDMEARIRGSADSPITLDGQSKYGAWQLPREPFRIDPDPAGLGGYNSLYLRTEPAGAPVKCWLEYRDTWAG